MPQDVRFVSIYQSLLNFEHTLKLRIVLEDPSSPSKRGEDIVDYKRGENIVDYKRGEDIVDYKRGEDLLDYKRDEDITKRVEGITAEKRDDEDYRPSVDVTDIL